jgi:hypothetical protein
MLEAPNIGWAIAGLCAGLACASLLAFGFVKKQPPPWRGWRVAPIVAIVIAFIDFFVLSSSKLPFVSADVAASALHHFAESISEQSRPNLVADDPQKLEPFTVELGQPPYLLHGERPKRYALEVRRDCDGPAEDRQSAAAGTLIYCVAKDRKQGWVTVVGLPAEAKFGPPALLSRGGHVEAVRAAAPEPESAEEPTPTPLDREPPEPTGGDAFPFIAPPTNQPDAGSSR